MRIQSFHLQPNLTISYYFPFIPFHYHDYYFSYTYIYSNNFLLLYLLLLHFAFMYEEEEEEEEKEEKEEERCENDESSGSNLKISYCRTSGWSCCQVNVAAKCRISRDKGWDYQWSTEGGRGRKEGHLVRDFQFSVYIYIFFF